MKKLSLIFLVAVCFQFTLAQHKTEIREISDDGKFTNSYIKGQSGEVIQTSTRLAAPFGTAPDWQAQRDRQIGGLAWGDYDGDGDLDLAAGCYFSNSFPPINDYETMIFRNDGGVLDTLPAWISTDERSTTDVKFADVNKDGLVDLLAANGNEGYVPSVIYMNSQTGLETTPSWISNDAAWTVGAAFHDVDGDGDLDLAFANQGNSVIPTKPIQIFFNNNGVLSNTPGYSSADEMITNTVAFADMDNNSVRDSMMTLITSVPSSVLHLQLTNIVKIDSIRINGVITTNYCYDALNGWVSFGMNIDPGDMIEMRFKYMTKGDMAACKWVNYQSGIYFNSNGVMSTLPGWTVGNTISQKGCAWADYDNDGYLDLALGGSGNSTVIYKNINGVMSSSPVWSSASTSTSSQDLIWGDVNRDGFPDLAVVHFGNRRTEIFMNDNGVIETTPSWTYIASSSSNAIAFGDVNGDGFLDLAIGTAREPVMVFINTSVIPVELTSFSLEVNGSDVTLHWQTSSEINNSGFEIERKNLSSDRWDRIGFVNGYGTTTQVHNYSYPDLELQQGKYQYRLKQIDLDGTFKYSHTVNVEIAPVNIFKLQQNYPNPFNPSTIISYSIPSVATREASSLRVVLRVFDILGREVAELVNEEKSSGQYEAVFNAEGLSSGIYMYSLAVQSNGETLFRQSKQMILIK
ncbi:MAG: VCBS repeat-containing protein [Ignavibacteriales bacterium]|nr:MAG: VCBS repeat-containing protein [Ignavibacteriales bacterium]